MQYNVDNITYQIWSDALVLVFLPMQELLRIIELARISSNGLLHMETAGQHRLKRMWSSVQEHNQRITYWRYKVDFMAVNVSQTFPNL